MGKDKDISDLVSEIIWCYFLKIPFIKNHFSLTQQKNIHKFPYNSDIFLS